MNHVLRCFGGPGTCLRTRRSYEVASGTVRRCQRRRCIAEPDRRHDITGSWGTRCSPTLYVEGFLAAAVFAVV